MSRVCEEFHLPVQPALQALALPDLSEFDPLDVADECAALMFEVMELRAFAEAKRAYQAAKPEDQPKLVSEHPLIALAQEIEFEIAGERLKQRRKAS